MNTVVTGGAGFIGSNLVHALLERGDRVVVLDNFSTGRRGNLSDYVDDIELVEGDLRSYERVHAAVARADVVFHQGALPSIPRSVQDPLTTDAVNVEGTLNVLLAARDADVQRVVFASSSSVYGEAPGLPRVEDQTPMPIAPYGVSKLAAESYCRAFHRVYGLETVSLRYFNIFGPRQDPKSEYSAVIPRFIKRLLDGEPPIIFGDGEQSRDFTYVDNVVDANLRAASVPDIGGEVFNIASAEGWSVNDLVRRLTEILESSVEPVYAPPRAGDVQASVADVRKARERLGYVPTVGFHEGLARTAASVQLETAHAVRG